MISLIVAASENNVIGRAGGLPWRLRDDLRRFKELTMGKPMVMGRKTFESIGRALPGRRNIVVTRQAGYQAEGCDVVASVDDALSVAGDAPEIMVIGGAEIYRQLLPRADRIHLTRVHATIDGDATFPELRADEWIETGRESLRADAANDFDATFLVLERR